MTLGVVALHSRLAHLRCCARFATPGACCAWRSAWRGTTRCFRWRRWASRRRWSRWARLFARRRDPRRPGERLAAALQEMGPSFIKLGQALSTRADLLSESVAADLARLQDHLPAFSGAEARRTIESRARPADRGAVRQLRRRAGRRRLDRPGAFRRHDRWPRASR